MMPKSVSGFRTTSCSNFCLRPLSVGVAAVRGARRLVLGGKLLPGILLREHAAEIGDIGIGLLRRKFAPRDLLGFGETSLQADDNFASPYAEEFESDDD